MDSEHEAQDELVEIGGRQYRVHPAAAMFPIMSGREFDELVEDVRVNGLREPVVVRGDQLVDGRNRVRACAAAGVAPEVRELERGTDVASWVMSVNVHRRHLDASQRALLASRLSALSGEVTLIQAGELMGVSRASVARAAAVEKGPEPLRAAAPRRRRVGGRCVRAARRGAGDHRAAGRGRSLRRGAESEGREAQPGHRGQAPEEGFAGPEAEVRDE